MFLGYRMGERSLIDRTITRPCQTCALFGLGRGPAGFLNYVAYFWTHSRAVASCLARSLR